MPRRSRWAAIALVALFFAGCTSSSTAHPSPGEPSPARALAGGCAHTVVTVAEPPAWAQGGWNVVRGEPWPVPWALGTGGDAVAYLFAKHLVASGSPRRDGTSNKVLWVARDTAVSKFVVQGHPLGQSRPLVEVPGGPSIVDAPSSGCWTFLLSWIAGGVTNHRSTINLDVLPNGSLPE